MVARQRRIVAIIQGFQAASLLAIRAAAITLVTSQRDEMTSASSILKSFAAISFFFRGWRPSVRGVLSVSRKGWIIVAATILVVVLLDVFMSDSHVEVPVSVVCAVWQCII